MAKARQRANGKLEEALTNLLQTQAIFVQNQAAFAARMAEMDRINAERFARIEGILLDHSRVLIELTRMLEALPEAVRDRIGFKVPGQV